MPYSVQTIVYIALGSNLGDRLSNLRGAVAALGDHPAVNGIQASPVYETRAHTLTAGERQPDYLNAVIRLRTTLALPELLEISQAVEKAAGRNRMHERRWAPRVLDLDILVFGTEVWSQERLTVPHPRMAERRFVLCPLFDLAPDLHVPPPVDATVRDLLARCHDPDRPARTNLVLL